MKINRKVFSFIWHTCILSDRKIDRERERESRTYTYTVVNIVVGLLWPSLHVHPLGVCFAATHLMSIKLRLIYPGDGSHFIPFNYLKINGGKMSTMTFFPAISFLVSRQIESLLNRCGTSWAVKRLNNRSTVHFVVQLVIVSSGIGYKVYLNGVVSQHIPYCMMEVRVCVVGDCDFPSKIPEWAQSDRKWQGTT